MSSSPGTSDTRLRLAAVRDCVARLAHASVPVSPPISAPSGELAAPLLDRFHGSLARIDQLYLEWLAGRQTPATDAGSQLVQRQRGSELSKLLVSEGNRLLEHLPDGQDARFLTYDRACRRFKCAAFIARESDDASLHAIATEKFVSTSIAAGDEEAKFVRDAKSNGAIPLHDGCFHYSSVIDFANEHHLPDARKTAGVRLAALELECAEPVASTRGHLAEMLRAYGFTSGDAAKGSPDEVQEVISLAANRAIDVMIRLSTDARFGQYVTVVYILANTFSVSHVDLQRITDRIIHSCVKEHDWEAAIFVSTAYPASFSADDIRSLRDILSSPPGSAPQAHQK